MHQIDFDTSTQESLRHLPPPQKSRIKAALREIAKDPQCGKTLQELLQGLWSYRVGTLRIVYKINPAKKKVHVVAIGPRRNIYKELENSRK